MRLPPSLLLLVYWSLRALRETTQPRETRKNGQARSFNISRWKAHREPSPCGGHAQGRSTVMSQQSAEHFPIRRTATARVTSHP